MPPPSENYQRNVNLWAARIVPLVLIAVTGYSVWVVAYLVSVQYLINPKSSGYHNVPRRTNTGIAILVFYLLLLPPYLLSYFRILQVVVTNPGYTRKRLHAPNETLDKQEKKQSFKWVCSSTIIEESAESRSRQDWRRNSVGLSKLDRTAVLDGSIAPPPGIEKFYSKDVFVCDQYGLPIFCDKCNNWKPDRTHHCSEIGRCVRRMDHFCPWVGGVVSETTMKFFLQFTFYATVFCGYVFGVMIWAIVDRQRRTGGRNGNWIAIVASAGLFGFIAVGMLFTTFRQQLLNLTTIEYLGRVYYMAVYLPSRPAEQADGSLRHGLITFPLPRQPIFDDTRRDIGREEAQISTGSRTFAIISSKPTDNPWDIGAVGNLKSVLGESYLDWILPFNYPPCCFHNHGDSDYPLGEDFERMKRDHGLSSTRRRRRRRRSSHGHGSRHSSR